jgi:hypothetical protein
MSPPADPSGLSRTELEARFVELLAVVSELKIIVAAQRDEIARLKGLKGRPSIKPSGMQKGTEAKPGSKRAKHRRRGKVTPRVTPETEVLRIEVACRDLGHRRHCELPGQPADEQIATDVLVTTWRRSPAPGTLRRLQ